MDKQMIIDNTIDARKLIDEVLAATFDLPRDDRIRAETIYRATNVLDDIDALLNLFEDNGNG